jgi:hypothetical protein
MSHLPSLAVALTLGFATRASAQATSAVEIFVGYYLPFGHFDPASVYSTDLPNQPSDLRGTAWGGAGHLSFGRRFGVEGQLSVAASTVPEVTTPGGPRGPTGARVSIVTLEAQYDISPTPLAYRVWLSGGPAFVRHGGDAYSRYGSPRSFGSALGIRLAVPIVSHLQLAAEATTVFYTLDVPMPTELRRNPGNLEHGAQRDAVLRIGLAWGHL